MHAEEAMHLAQQHSASTASRHYQIQTMLAAQEQADAFHRAMHGDMAAPDFSSYLRQVSYLRLMPHMCCMQPLLRTHISLLYGICLIIFSLPPPFVVLYMVIRG